ncbi:carbon-nitrogen hydrolase family protein [Rhodoferax sp.]|uniref:carbon-nitrogen hydrolase family protein n=1 Tax=Rhodoferax sp. TaxID=50421 RepID=UPI00374D2B03
MTTHRTLRIAAAQSCSLPGDIAANLQTHLRFIAAAREAGAELLLFPELSLSGYEPTLLRNCLLEPGDSRLAVLPTLAREAGMTIVVGAPMASGVADKPFIGAISFYADGSHSVYRKQHLHPGEESFATPGAVDASNPNGYTLGGTAAALAICADSMHPPHAERAAAAGAALYLASSLVSVGGFDGDARQLQHYARQFKVGVLLANHGGATGGYTSAGKSSFWAPGGELLAAAPGTGDALLLATLEGGAWRAALQTL